MELVELRPRHSLLLIDGHALLLSVAEALSHRSERAIEAQPVARMFLRRMLMSMRVHEPTHCLVAFQSTAPSWRTCLSVATSAWRQPPSGAIADAQSLAQSQLSSWSIRVASHDGVDVDDTISYFCAKAVSRGFTVTMLCRSPVLAPMLNPFALQVDEAHGVWLDAAWYRSAYGVGLELVLDAAALRGDPALGISGIPGFGPKRAADALALHGSLAGVLDAADTFPPSLAVAVHAHRQGAEIGRRLLEPARDLDLRITPRELELSASMRDEIRSMPAPRQLLVSSDRLSFPALLDNAPSLPLVQE